MSTKMNSEENWEELLRSKDPELWELIDLSELISKKEEKSKLEVSFLNILESTSLQKNEGFVSFFTYTNEHDIIQYEKDAITFGLLELAFKFRQLRKLFGVGEASIAFKKLEREIFDYCDQDYSSDFLKAVSEKEINA